MYLEQPQRQRVFSYLCLLSFVFVVICVDVLESDHEIYPGDGLFLGEGREMWCDDEVEVLAVDCGDFVIIVMQWQCCGDLGGDCDCDVTEICDDNDKTSDHMMMTLWGDVLTVVWRDGDRCDVTGCDVMVVIDCDVV